MYSETSLAKRNIVFIDVETTGLFPDQGDTICELGAVKYIDGQPSSQFSELVNPQRSIPLYVSNINHIFDDDIKNAPLFAEVADRFLAFIGNSVVCGYNVEFDLGFLNAELSRIDYPLLDLPALDVLRMARRACPGLAHYNLGYMAQHFRLDTGTLHRALDDAILTGRIYIELQKKIAAKGIARIVDQLSLVGVKKDCFQKMQEPKVVIIKESIFTRVNIRVTYISGEELRALLIRPIRLVEDKPACLIGRDAHTDQEITLFLRDLVSIEIA